MIILGKVSVAYASVDGLEQQNAERAMLSI